MADAPVWQPNYVDLSDDRTMRFGGECVICGARYATPGQPRTTPLRLDGAPDPEMIAAFSYFDAAFRELQTTCFRCQRTACPDCWDEDHRMCAQCAAERGLARSPHRGLPSSAPLARGELHHVSSGRYHDVDRPSWLNRLLESSMSPASGPLPAPQSGPLGGGVVQTWMLGVTSTGSLTRQPFPQAPTAPVDPDGVAAAATIRAPSVVEEARVDGARVDGARVVRGEPKSEAQEPSTRVTMLECPRCGVANFDFVTRCSNCQLQLIQTCLYCEHLNPGHAEICEACGQSLERPRGWSGVHSTIAMIPPEEARERVNSVPMKATQAPRGYVERASPRTTLPPMPQNAPPPDTPAPMVQAPARIAEGMLGLSTDESADGRAFRFLPPAAERIIRLISVIGIVAIVSAGIAAVLSPSANTALYQMLHLDIRMMLETFGAQLQTMWRHLRK